MPQGGFLNEQVQGGFIAAPTPSVKVDSNYMDNHERFVMPRRRYRNVTTVEIDVIARSEDLFVDYLTHQTVVLGPFQNDQGASIVLAQEILETLSRYDRHNFYFDDKEVEGAFAEMLTRYGLEDVWPIDKNDDYFEPDILCSPVRIVQWDERGLPSGTTL